MTTDSNQPPISENFINEAYQTRLLLRETKPLNRKRVALNIGAFTAQEVIPLASEGWDLHIFEANPENYAKLVENVGRSKHQSNIHTYNMAIALGDETSTTFYVSNQFPGIGSLRKWHETHEPIEVPAISLPNFCRSNGISAIDYVLIDAETMDLPIMMSHDWQNVPVGACTIEYGQVTVEEIYDAIMDKCPRYKNQIFEYHRFGNNRFWKPGQTGGLRCVLQSDMASRREREDAGQYRGMTGNILFYME